MNGKCKDSSTYNILCDCVGHWWVLLSLLVVSDLSYTEYTTLPEHPLGQIVGQILVTRLLVSNGEKLISLNINEGNNMNKSYWSDL